MNGAKEVMTFKSGKFVFHYPKVDDLETLLAQVRLLNEMVNDIPLLPQWASQIDTEIMYSSIASTARIEGNPITEQGVKQIAQQEDTPEYSQKHKRETQNLLIAYKDFVEELGKTAWRRQVKQFPPLDEEIIKNIHEIVTFGISHESNIPGQYRNGEVHVGDKAHGGVYRPPRILDDIKTLMKEFISWINGEELQTQPIIRAALAHYYLGVIHPFWDGNGRTARILEGLMLETSGIRYLSKELSNYYYLHVDDYYNAFSESINTKNSTPFVGFVLKASVASFLAIKEKINFRIKILVLKDYYQELQQQKKITRRQHDLLSLLLDKSADITFTANDMLTKHPFSLVYRDTSQRAAQNDLKKLLNNHCLAMLENKVYRLNLDVLNG